MNLFAAGLMARLNLSDPYRGFPYAEYPSDLQGGGDSPVFRQLIAELRPKLVIEVGSWKGASAVRLATLLKEQQADAAVVCVDTWLGSFEHLTGGVPGWDAPIHRQHGYPTLYYQFLANVCHAGCQDTVIPVPNTSANTARWLFNRGILADLIYIDASHEEDDVYQDLNLYWKLLRPGGVMFGDDWHAYWYGVICAVNRFARERGLSFRITDPHWVIPKPAAGGS